MHNSMKLLLVFAITLMAFAYFDETTFAQNTPNTITFDNQSGEFAIVKLIGPTKTAVEVLSGQKRTVNVEAGDYYLLGRYGTQPERYKYTRGDPFNVSQPSGKYSAISITLHKVVDGNYNVRNVSKDEFEKTIALDKTPNTASHQISTNKTEESHGGNDFLNEHCEKEPVLFMYTRTSNFFEKDDPLKNEIITILDKKGFEAVEFYKEGKIQSDLSQLKCQSPEKIKTFNVVLKDSLVVLGPYSGNISFSDRSNNTKLEESFSGKGSPNIDVIFSLEEILEAAHLDGREIR